MKSEWQQALREFVLNDELLNDQVVLAAHKFVKSGGCSNVNFALSTLMDHSWAVLALVWEAWQDDRLPAPFDSQRCEATYRRRYHELFQQFNECRAAWLEEISALRDQKRSGVWDAALQNAYEAAMQHDVFEFVPEAALAEEHRPYFKAALQECIKMALTSMGDERCQLLLERIRKLEAELAASLAEIERLKEADREMRDKSREIFKKPLRPKPSPPSEAPVVEPPPKPPSSDKEAQTDFDEEPPQVVIQTVSDPQDAWKLEAEREKCARLAEEIRRLEALLKERDDRIAELQRMKEELEASLGLERGSAARLARIAQLEKEREALLEEVRQLKAQIQDLEAMNEDLREQLEAANRAKPAPVVKPPSKAVGVQTRNEPTKPPPPPPPPPKQVLDKASQAAIPPVEPPPPPPPPPPPVIDTADLGAQTEPIPKPPTDDATAQVDLREPEPPPGDDEELLRRLQHLKRQLDAEREKFEALEMQLKRQLQEALDRAQALEQEKLEMQRQFEMGLDSSRAAELKLRKQLEKERDEARQQLELERERCRKLEAALQELRRQVEDLKRQLESMAKVSKVDQVLEEVRELGPPKPLKRVFQRLWTDAFRRDGRSKENESLAFQSDPAFSEAVMRWRHLSARHVSAGAWLFGDVASDAVCPCCGRSCNAELLATSPWRAADDDAEAPAASAATQGTLASGVTLASAATQATLASPSGKPLGSAVPLGHMSQSLSQIQSQARDLSGEDFIVKSLSAAFDEAVSTQRIAPPWESTGATSAQAAEDARSEESTRRLRLSAPVPSQPGVPVRAASLANGGLSFTEHCQRLRESCEASGPLELQLDTSAKLQSKSLQLSHLLTGPQERRPGASIPVRHSTSLLPLGNAATDAAARAAVALKGEDATPAAATTALEALEASRQAPRRWLPGKEPLQGQGCGSGPLEVGGASRSPPVQPRAHGSAMQKAKSASQIGVPATPTQDRAAGGALGVRHKAACK